MAENKKENIDTRDIQDSSFSSLVPNNIHELVWETKSRTLREITLQYRLPLTVKLKTGDAEKYFPNAASVKITSKDSNTTPSSKSAASHSSTGAGEMIRSTHQNSAPASSSYKAPEGEEAVSEKDKEANLVLQIHELRRRKIILARKMTWDKRQHDYVVTGGQMEIFASVTGLVEVVPDNGRPVEYYDMIDGIAGLQPARFLVRTSTVGYKLITADTGNCSWMPWEIKSGEILTTGIVYMDNRKNKSVQKNFLKKLRKKDATKKEQEVKYLQCFDLAGSEIMIPLFMSGVFSPIGDSSLANYDAVYEFHDLIMAFGLPVNVQFIHANTGDNSFQCPRGVIRLYGTREEEIAVVSKVMVDGDLYRNDLNYEKFEIPLDSEMLFSRGVVKKKTGGNSNAVHGRSARNEQRKVSEDKMEDIIVKTKEYTQNASGETISETYQQVSVSLSDKLKDIVGDSLQCDSREYSTHKNSTLPARAATNQTLCGNNTGSELYTSSTHADSVNFREQFYGRGIELPEKADKEPKSKPSYILEKLSVRKVKKVRAKLKELKNDDVFSRRLSKRELGYQEFYDDLDEGRARRSSDYKIASHDNAIPGSSDETYQSSSTHDAHPTNSSSTQPKTGSVYVSNTISLIQRRASMQKRELPPVPLDSLETSDLISPHQSAILSEESVYEHLPLAPERPGFRRASSPAILSSECRINAVSNGEDNEDDYMQPIQVSQESKYMKGSDFQLRHNAAGYANPYVSIQSATSRDVCNKTPGTSWRKSADLDRNCPLDMDGLFNVTYSSTEMQQGHHRISDPKSTVVSPLREFETAHVPHKLTDNRALFEHSLVDNPSLETRHPHCSPRHKSRYTKHTAINPNATLRSHNFRNMFPSVKEIFPIHDSLSTRQVCDNALSNHTHSYSYQQPTYTCSSRPRLSGSHSVDDSKVTIYPFHHYCHSCREAHYSESEPSFQANSGPYLVSGFKESLTQGDDSAISICSRDYAGYLNDSEYKSNISGEQTKDYDDGWVPPDDIEEFSVHEVSKSLRYIGMKDRVVLRFSKEQIDGRMLCTLDEQLLKEGFPELNALEIKKIVDFIQGWRPKKS